MRHYLCPAYPNRLAVSMQDGDTGKKRRTTKRDKGPAAKRLRGREVVAAARPTDLSQVGGCLQLPSRLMGMAGFLLSSPLLPQVEVESSVLEGCHIAFANYGEHK